MRRWGVGFCMAVRRVYTHTRVFVRAGGCVVCSCRFKGEGTLTPGTPACIGSGERYVSGGGNIGYVMDLAEKRGAATNCTLKRTASLEGTHYLHLQERERSTLHRNYISQTRGGGGKERREGRGGGGGEKGVGARGREVKKRGESQGEGERKGQIRDGKSCSRGERKRERSEAFP